MDWRLLVGKGIFGLFVLVAYVLGLVDDKTAIAVILFLLSADHIAEGHSLYSMRKELEREGGRK